MPVEPYSEPVTTRVMYVFSLQYSQDLQEEAVMSTVDSSVRGALDSMMRQIGTDLNRLAEDNSFDIIGVLSFPVQSQEGEMWSCRLMALLLLLALFCYILLV